MLTYNWEKIPDGVLGRSNHVVASVEIGPSGHQDPVAVILHVLAATDTHCFRFRKPVLANNNNNRLLLDLVAVANKVKQSRQ